MHDLEIVVITWNSQRDIARCLRAVLDSGTRRSYRFTVVDNASSDGTAPLVRETFPDVRLICNQENRGFAAANNQVFGSSSAPYWMLLNPDTEIAPGSIDRLLDFLDDSPGVAVAGPLLVNADGSPQHPGQRFPSLRNILWETFFLDRMFPHSATFGAHRGMGRVPPEPEPVDFVHGAAMVVRREAAQKAGLLDEAYFMYFEEVDWCYRLREQGSQSFIVPSARTVHHGGVELGHYDALRLLHYHRSLLRFFSKHRGRFQRILLRPLIGFRAILRILVWSVAPLAKPGISAAAISSIKGYAQVIRLLLVGG